MTRYYVEVSKELGQALLTGDYATEGFRFISRATVTPPGQPDLWEAEDDQAPAELEGRIVEPVFRKEWLEDKLYRIVVAERRLAE